LIEALIKDKNTKYKRMIITEPSKPERGDKKRL
jgi:hypothetical protein